MSFIVFACACSTTNSKPFSTRFYFSNFVDDKFLWNWFYVLLHVSDSGNDVFGECDVYFSTTVAWPIFTEIWMTSSLEFDAPARCMSTTE